VHVEVGGDRRVDGVEELLKRLAAMPPMTFADDGAGRDVQGREQRRRAMPTVVVGPALGTPGAIGRIGAVRSRA
jgi:hypothetical protein